jgi:hypothetical protein
MAAMLIFERKTTLFSLSHQKMVMISMDLFWIEDPNQIYPEGYKYSWIALDIENEDNRVLFDCHPPKGPHIHINNNEVPYEWISLEQTEKDFWTYIDQIFGPLEEVVK